MKKIYLLSICMLVIVAMLPQELNAQTFYKTCSTGQCLRYSIISPSEVNVIGGAGLIGGNMVIPDSVSYNGMSCSVTSIGHFAFNGCSGLTSVTIPNSVTFIDQAAFQRCSGLTSVTIPNSVTSINDFAFSGCSGLTSVTIPNSVTSIGICAFANCSGLTSITIPNSVTFIGNRAFANCSGLTSINIPSSVTDIGGGAFGGCCVLTISVDSDNPVYDSRGSCNAIVRTATNTLVSGCNNTTIPNSVTSIGEYAFRNCSGLTSIIIPNSVTSIGASAFYGCSGLTSIIIPNSVTSIGDGAFGDCSGLTISVDSDNPVYDSRGSCNAIIETATNTLVSGCNNNTTIPNFVTSIGDYAFYGCSGLTSVSIPNSVTSIGLDAFYDCSGLTSVSISNSVTSINYNAFRNCSGLTSITIPNSVTSIGPYAFYDCSGLTSVSIPNSVTSIGFNAFSHCSGLTSITIPNSVTSIGTNAFFDCSGLTSISVDSDNPVYDSRGGCNAIIETATNTLVVGCHNSNIPNSITSIYGTAFYGCSGLTSINIPNSVTFIDTHTFYGCSGLTSITIPNSVTYIGYEAFAGCSGLTSINIPSSVTYIDNTAFMGCSRLNTITVDSNNPVYDSRDSCNAIIETNNNHLITGCKNTVIPATVTFIENYAFYDCLNSDILICKATTPPELNGCVCTIFGDVPDYFRVLVPCGSLPEYTAAWPEELNFHGFAYDTSITVVTSAPYYIWNNETYYESGDYVQTFESENGCDSVVTLHLTITVGIDDYDLANSMTLYPNPTSDLVNVQLTMNNEQLEGVDIQVFDVYGRLLNIVETGRAPSSQTTQIDLSRYAQGVYFVKAVAEGKVIAVRKVVKR